MKNLEEIVDFVNSKENWRLCIEKYIKESGFIDHTSIPFCVCAHGSREVVIVSMLAKIIETGRFVVRYSTCKYSFITKTFDSIESAKKWIQAKIDFYTEFSEGNETFWFEIWDHKRRCQNKPKGIKVFESKKIKMNRAQQSIFK